ncbi:MAG: hypothetical protein JJU33_03390 [Phycisphaerales bacterium]|nr:hypothetical protein [Phycisphaerales bacterium]
MHISAAAVGLASLTSASGASTIITAYDLFGEPGNQAFTAPSESATGVTGLNMTRGTGLNATSAANSFSSSGWNTLNASEDYFSFGFTVAENAVVNLSSLFIATRASNTGPGDLGLFFSGDGFSNNLFTFTQSGTAFLNSEIDLSGLAGLTGEVEFRIVALSDTRADGNTGIAAGGTLRIAEFFEGGEFSPVRFVGEVVVIPLPGAAGLGLAGLGLVAVRRRRA